MNDNVSHASKLDGFIMEIIKQLTDEFARKGFWQSIVDDLGFEWYSYFFQSSDVRIAPQMFTNFPEDWKKKYLENEFDKIDPIHIQARNRLIPFYWGGEEFMRLLTRQQRQFFLSACERGISSGYAIPIHSNSSYGLLTIATNDLTRLMRKSIKRNEEKLHIISIYFHDLVQSDITSKNVTYQLTDREKECLVMISNGKKQIRVAKDMGVSTNTVQFHIKNIKRKMNVATVQQAVALANSNKLIYS